MPSRSEPTYPYIGHAARRTHTIGDAVALGADIDSVIDASVIDDAPRPDLVVLVAPNNPTGGSPSDEAVAAALADESRLVLIDEAYADFSQCSRLGQIGVQRNLVIARSFSKSMLAGIHVGLAAGDPEVIAIIERMFTAPYHIDAMQLVVARRYREIRPYVERAAITAAAERDWLIETLDAIDGVSARPSRANFVLFEIVGGSSGASAVHARLAAAGVRIRDVGGLPGLAGFLRVTVGTPEENALFVAELRASL